MLKALLATAAGAAAVVVIRLTLPDLRRYLRISRM
ncbi:DUF6893 family small protein [Streptomyces uncialis]|nr:hypothetical protein YW7DRAFT_03978 [Streptomyces sp. AmelKG-E11A]